MLTCKSLPALPGCWSLCLWKYLRATNFKFCDETLQVLSPNLFFFSFIICVQVELLTILHKTLLKDGRALAQKAQNHKYCGMVAYVFRDMEILLFTIAEKFIIN